MAQGRREVAAGRVAPDEDLPRIPPPQLRFVGGPLEGPLGVLEGGGKGVLRGEAVVDGDNGALGPVSEGGEEE